MLEARALVRRFGPVTAVDGVSFAIARGDVLGLLGPNGAGKTTTMKMLTGFLAPSAGSARVLGHDVAEEPVMARQHLGYLPEGAPLYDDMTAAGFLRFIADVRGLAGTAAADAIARAVATLHLEPVLEQPIETLSKGYRRRVALAQAILHDPDVLILDEPTDGLDPNQKHEVRHLMERMAAEKAIIVSTHILEEVEAFCTRVIIIDRGRIVADGAPSELKARSRYAGAVTVELPRESVEAAAARLGALPMASGIERQDESGIAQLTVLPGGDGDLLGAVRDALAAEGIGVRRLALEAGRLDDVFRALTHSDAATDALRAEAAA
ncbi:MAG: ABC transporter ATP-binding protein [Alphaproteobacteria bacterium]|nr:MAG: ABC transporter ATP-binding protein [Alphaproteobacteria bacterium]